MNEESKISKLILKSAYITIIVLIIAIIALIILKYNVEGEQNMPFKLSSVLVISNAQGHQETESKKYKWDMEIYQINDIYLNIERNKNYKETELIESIVLENFKIDNQPIVGNIEFYRTANEGTDLFEYKEEYQIKDQIKYIGDTASAIKDLKISNQGGTLIIRAVNKTGKRYTSNEAEFKHSGKLLNEAQIAYEEIKMTVSFDLIINLEDDIAFRANIKLDLPTGNIINEGASSLEIKDMKNIVFKREEKQ